MQPESAKEVFSAEVLPTGAAPRRQGARSVLQTAAARLLVVGLNAGTGVLTARALHPVGRGDLAAMLLWPQVLSGALTLGLPSALTFHLRNDRARAPQLLAAALVLGLAIGLVGSAAAMGFAPWLLHRYAPPVVRVGRLLMPNLLVGIYLLIGRAALEAEHDFRMSAVVLTATPLLTLLGLLFLAAAHALTPLHAGIVYTLSGIPVCARLWSRLPVRFPQPLRALQHAALMLLSYGLRSFGIDLCGTLGFYVDQVLVVSLVSPASMGVYVVALSASRVLNVPQTAMASVLFPSMVGLGRAAIAVLVGRSLRIGFTVALLSLGLTLACGHLLLALVYGPAFASVGATLAILTAEAGLAGCVSIAAQAFMATNRPGLITAQQVIGLLASVPCLLLLIPRWGLAGAAVSILFGTTLRFLFALVSFRHSFGGRWPGLFLDRASLAWCTGRLGAAFPGFRFFPVPSAATAIAEDPQ